MTFELKLLAIVIVTSIASYADGQEKDAIKLDPNGGKIVVQSNTNAQTSVYKLQPKYWDYDKMLKVVFRFSNLSYGDSILLSEIGLVRSEGCYILVQTLAGSQKLFSNSCAVDEGKMDSFGCSTNTVEKFSIRVETAASSSVKTVIQVSYKLYPCNANISVNTTPSDFITPDVNRSVIIQATTQAGNSDHVNVNNSFSKNGSRSIIGPTVPSTENMKLVENSTTVKSATTEACLECSTNILIIVLSVLTSALIVLVMLALICRRRIQRKLHSVIPTSSDIARPFSGDTETPMLSPGNDFSRLESPQSLELTERYIFSPPVQRRASAANCLENTTVQTNGTNSDNMIHRQQISNSTSNLYEPPINARFSRSVGDEEVNEYSTIASTSAMTSQPTGFSGAVSTLLNSRSTEEEENRKAEVFSRRECIYTFPNAESDALPDLSHLVKGLPRPYDFADDVSLPLNVNDTAAHLSQPNGEDDFVSPPSKNDSEKLSYENMIKQGMQKNDHKRRDYEDMKLQRKSGSTAYVAMADIRESVDQK